jgi:hypothetical protein
MQRGKKEKNWTIVGLVVALVGVVWFGLAAGTQVLQGMVQIFGYPLGPGLVLGGLIISGVYFFRWRRIQQLTSSKNLLAQWNDGISEVFIAADCGYINENLHLWAGRGARLERVELVARQGYDATSTYLEIDYANLERGGMPDPITGNRWYWKHSKVSVCVPPDKLVDAQRMVEKLQEKVVA